MAPRRLLVVLGTRPDAIKLAPVIEALRGGGGTEVTVLATGQHKELLKDVLDAFAIRADLELRLLREGQSLAELLGRAVVAIERAIVEVGPDRVLVQGDTATAFAAALAAFYARVPVAQDRKSTRLNSSHIQKSRMPSSA